MEDVTIERDQGGGDSRWDPAYPLEIGLVRCPGGKDALSFGSYLVFWKLEQNVRGFNDSVRELAGNLGIDEQLAAAMAMGRYRDGTPLAMSGQNRGLRPVWNNFDYADDLDGSRCPFHAHVRRR